MLCPECTFDIRAEDAAKMSALFNEHTANLAEHMRAGSIVVAGKTDTGRRRKSGYQLRMDDKKHVGDSVSWI